MEIRIKFVDPLVGCSRQTVEEQIESWLGSSGELLGGGAATDGSWAHIDFSVEDDVINRVGLQAYFSTLKTILRAARVPPSTKITAFLDETEKEETVVG